MKNKKKERIVKNHSLYVLLDKDDRTFFIWYCDTKNVYDAFKYHYSLRYLKTKKWIQNIKNENRKPCIFTLETVNGTRQECYSIALIWTKIFLENGFKSIETQSVLSDVHNIYDDNLEKYFNRKEIKLNEILDCRNCIQPTYQSIKCDNYIENNLDKLKPAPRKKKRIEVSFNDDEYEILEQKSFDSNMNITRYIKEISLDGVVKKINFDVINTLIKDINRLYKMLNAYIITLVSTSQYYPSELDDIQKSINEIKKNYKKILRLINKVIYLHTKRTSKKS